MLEDSIQHYHYIVFEACMIETVHVEFFGNIHERTAAPLPTP